MIDIKLYHVTEIATNCCYLVDEATGKSAVTDPGAESKALISQIEKDGGRLEYVILTHGHYDHICFAKQLADKFGAKIVTGKHNNEFLSNTDYNGTARHGIPFKPFSADILLDDGETFKLGETEIKYLYTPGHTSGCGVYLFDDVMISGDTLFCRRRHEYDRLAQKAQGARRRLPRNPGSRPDDYARARAQMESSDEETVI